VDILGRVTDTEGLHNIQSVFARSAFVAVCLVFARTGLNEAVWTDIRANNASAASVEVGCEASEPVPKLRE
jgi:hypothetical protein